MRISDWSSDVCSSDLIVDALAEQVLAETALLALEHVGQRFQRTLVGAGDRAAASAVVEQRVDRFLQHALLVADDDVRRAQFHQPFQAVVAVDDATVEVVEVRRSEEHTSELQSLMRISYAVFCLKKKKNRDERNTSHQ